jgi:hypothetical protein
MNTPTAPIGIKAPPSLNPSPKQRFRESADNISRHKSMLETREFERGIDFALMEYQAQLAIRVTDQYTAMSAGLKMQGALEFIQTLKTLTENRTITVTTPTDNLSGNLR